MRFYLLSDFGDWAEYGQFAAAAVAVMLSIISMIQTKKIKELADITEELARQTKELQKQNLVLEKRLTHERLLSLENRIPVFEPNSKVYITKYGLGYEIKIKNIGRKAFNISISEYDIEFMTITNPVDSCGTDDSLNILIRWKTLGYEPTSNFSFRILYQNNFNQWFDQIIIIKNNEEYEITPPHDPL